MPAVTEVGSNSPDHPQTVEIHVVQFVKAEVNISVNMQRQVQGRRSGSRSKLLGHSTQRRDRCQGWRELTIQTSSIHRSRRFIKHTSRRSQIPEIMRRQVPMIQKVQAIRCLARRFTQPKRSSTEFDAAQTPAALRKEQTQFRRAVKPQAERSASREVSADKGTDSRKQS